MMIPTNREWTHYDPQGPSFAGFCKPGSIDETNRLVLARVFDGGITFRRQIIRAAREPIFAPPIEVSLDKKRIVMTCHWLESIDMRYLYLFLCLLSVGCISVFFGGMSDAISSSIFIVVLIAACCVGVVRKFHFEKLKRLLVYGNAPHTVINAKLHPTDLLCVGTQAQNIVIYRDYIPFEFAGAEICNWSFVIDTGKKVDEYKNNNYDSLDVRTLEHEIYRQLAVQFGAAICCKDILVINGLDAGVIQMFTDNKSVKSDRPNQSAAFIADNDESANDKMYTDILNNRDTGIAPIDNNNCGLETPTVELDINHLALLSDRWPNIARRYTWACVMGWGGEVAFSVFTRTTLRGRMLYVECLKYVLSPIARDKRPSPDVDRSWSFSEMLSVAISGAVGGLFLLPFSALLVVLPVFISHRRLLRKHIKSLKLNGYVNVGAETSIRRSMMGNEYRHIYQKDDVNRLSKECDKLILEATASILEKCGIDVTDFRNKELTIYNSGIMVKQGNVSAGTLAVGESATANTNVGLKPSYKVKTNYN